MADQILTSENVMGLKHACTVIKGAYRDYCLSLISKNESAILPMVLPDVLGLSSDLTAVKESIDDYSKITLDDIPRPASNPLDLRHSSDLANVSGTFPLSPVEYDKIKSEVDFMFDGIRRQRPVGSVNVSYGGDETYVAEGASATFEGFSGTGGEISTFFKEKYKGSFLNTLLQECIPCEFRIASINALDPFKGLVAMFESELVVKFNDIIRQIKALLTNNDILDDICSLLNFLNFQCVPDLFGMLSVLNMLMLKLMDLKLVNPTGIFHGFLSTIFSGVFTGLNALLDKYIQLILGPIDCIISSLDQQLIKLDVGAGINEMTDAKLSFLQNRRSDIEAKVVALQDRRDFLMARNMDGTYLNEDSSVVKVGDTVITGRDVFASLGLETLDREQEIQNIDDEIIELQGRDGNAGELADVNRQILELKEENRVPTLGRRATIPLKEFRASLGDSLQLLREGLLDGRDMINGTLEVIKKELERLLQGRAFNAEDRIEGARNLQRIARLIGIIRTLISLAKTGDICKGNDMDAIGDFLRTNDLTGFHDYYYGKDENGEERLIVIVDDVTLDLEGSLTPGITDLKEIKKLNKAGIIPDIGSTDFTATGPFGKATIGIMTLNICGEKSVSSTHDLANVKKWLSGV